jgi:hypothetical protein
MDMVLNQLISSRIESIKTYECTICHGINSVSRLHCQHCGTIPASYSWQGVPIRERANTIVAFEPIESVSNTIRVLVAWGVERQVSRRTIKRKARTVPLDYYAEV